MARRPGNWTLPPRSGGPPYTTTFHEGPIRYTEIYSWVIKRHGDLLPKAIDLASSNSIILTNVQYGTSDLWTVLKQIMEIILAYGESIDRAEGQSFGSLIQRALEPAGKSSAMIMFELLRERETRELIERYSVGNAMEVLRSNILAEDRWRYSVLSRMNEWIYSLLAKIDEWLEIDPQVSLVEWGNDYVEHTHRIVEGLSNSMDWGRLDETIREMDEISSSLGVDLYDEISTLRNRRDNLPSEGDDNYEDDGSESSSTGSRNEGTNSLGQLDNMFASLLE